MRTPWNKHQSPWGSSTRAAAAAAAVVTALGVTGATATAVYIGTYVAVAVAASFAVSAVSGALYGKPSSSSAGAVAGGGSDIAQEAKARSRVVRSSVESRKFVYGEVVVSGPMVYANTTGDDKEFLHMVIAIASHRVDAYGSVWFNDTEIPVSDRDAAGNVVNGIYAGQARIKVKFGTTGQSAEAALVSDDIRWTNNHKLSGVAYIVVRLEHDEDVFPVGIPNVKVSVKGKRLVDPRISSTVYSANTALAIRDYLTDPLGLNASDDEIDDTTFIAAANICDELVPVRNVSNTIEADASDDTITLELTGRRGKTGEQVEFLTTGSLPGGLSTSTPYYLIRVGATVFKVATTHARALAGTSLNITSTGTGNHTMVKKNQVRYDAHGVVGLDKSPVQVVEDMLTSMGGVLTYTQGKYQIFAAAASSASHAIDETWLREGSVVVRPHLDRQTLFNAVRGTFVDPDRDWQPTDFPPVENSFYESEDGGEQLVRDIELPFTIDTTRAQRLAKIHLEKSRQGVTVELPCNFKALPVAVWDIVTLSLDKFGFASKEFRVLDWQLDGSNGINLIMQEEVSTVYDWNNGNATDHDLAPNTNIAPALVCEAPGTPTVVESLYETIGSAGVRVQLDVTWPASPDTFVRTYQVEFKLTSDSEWQVSSPTTSTSTIIRDIAPGKYDIRVKATNSIFVSSEYVTTSFEVMGLTAAPVDMTGVTISAMGGLAVIRWDQHPDLDVKVGGTIVFRHQGVSVLAAWPNSTSIGDAVTGADTVAALPLKPGAYLMKAIDSSGNPSTNAVIVYTKDATALNWSTLDTVSAHPTWSGTKTNTAVDGSNLKLTAMGLFDDIPDLDDISSVDSFGGIVSSGTYDFAAGIDLGSVKRVRLQSLLTAQVFNALDFIDERITLIDTWADFDGATGDEADVQMWVRETDDDPAASPTWSDYHRLDSSEFNARGFDPQLRLSTKDSSYNVLISAATVNAEEIL